MGLATAVNRLRESTAESKVVVLVTDGVNNTGQIGPKAAAEAARALDIKVYTVGVGTEGLAPVPVDTPFGVQYRQVQVELDEELLTAIAEKTGAQYFRATDAASLEVIFDTIDSMEKTRIESRVRVLYSELFLMALIPAGVLLLLERTLVGTRLRRIP
jgi:Ca-activated chloride channel family protein